MVLVLVHCSCIVMVHALVWCFGSCAVLVVVLVLCLCVELVQGITRKDGARPALPELYSLCVVCTVCCKCVVLCCHRVSNQLRLNKYHIISYHISIIRGLRLFYFITILVVCSVKMEVFSISVN